MSFSSSRSPRQWIRVFGASLFLILSAGSLIAQTETPVTLLSSSIVFPETINDQVFSRVMLQSDGFTGDNNDNLRLFINHTLIKVEWKNPSSTTAGTAAVETALAKTSRDRSALPTVFADLNVESQQVEFFLPWRSPLSSSSDGYSGPLVIQPYWGGQAGKPVSVMVAGVRSRWEPAILALIITATIFAIPIGLVWARPESYEVDGEHYGVLATLFLEKETDTYSLSKFQFYAWTAAGLTGYIVATISKSLVQGHFEFGDIPQGLPGIVLVSAATTGVARAVTTTRGGKGAGGAKPSLADFVTSGGLVLAERFQFFVWTLIGVFTFFFLIIFSDPATLGKLPPIPPEFLQLMGVSSMGYLGGKLARKPGPIIDEIAAVLGSLTLTIKGRKLSKTAGLKIAGDVVGAEHELQIFVKEADLDGTQDDGFYKTLTARIEKPNPEWLESAGKYYVQLINPDGQEAEWFYTTPSQPTIDIPASKASAPAADGKLLFDLTGSELSEKATVTIDGTLVGDAHEMTKNVPAEKLDDKTKLGTKLTIQIAKPNPDWAKPGNHKLVLKNSDGGSAEYPFTIP